MRKLVIIFVTFVATSALWAQIVDVSIYGDCSKNGYTKVIESKAGTAAVNSTSGRTTCDYVQLWAGGPYWATFNVGSTITDYASLTVGADPNSFENYIDQAPYYNTANVGGLYAWNYPNFNGRKTNWTKGTGIGIADVATAIWGSNWNTPTYAQLDSLQNINYGKTTWTWCDGSTTQYVSGCTLKGFKVSGVGDYSQQSIFLPAAGYSGWNYSVIYYSSYYGYYWSVTAGGTNKGYCLAFILDSRYMCVYGDDCRSVRAVLANNAKSAQAFNIKLCTDGCGASNVITCSQGQQLRVTAEPKDGQQFVRWSDDNTDNPRYVVVTQDSTLTAIFASNFIDSLYIHSDCSQNGVVIGNDNHEWVDLGLPSGIKWATCNIGAIKPNEYGDFYAWGEIEPKTEYSWRTYKHCSGTSKSLTKYCKNTSYGNVDNKTKLDSCDEVVICQWGSGWRMPTYNELNELVNNCTISEVTCDGVYGAKCVGPSGDSIFLPSAGAIEGTTITKNTAFYWASSPIESISNVAPALYIWGWRKSVLTFNRSAGFPIRAVRDKSAPAVVDPYRIVVAASMCDTTNQFYVPGTTTTKLVAVTDSCIKFVCWSDGNTDNPRTITINSDTTLTAIFEKIQFNVSINTSDSIKGKVKMEESSK